MIEGRLKARTKAETAPEVAADNNANRELWLTVLFAALHLPLGIALKNAGMLGIVHPILVFGIGLYLAARIESKHANVALVLAYIIGAEVLWRMAQTPIYWEFGKYASVAIIVVAMVRRSRFDVPKLPTIFFAFLIPGCLLTIVAESWASATSILSFYMSGPLLLFFSCWFFYKTKISPAEFKQMLIAMIIPLISVGFTTFFYAVSAESITFGGESNFETSGGFGPNQVSAMLGLGVFVSFAGWSLLKNDIGFKIFFGLTGLWCAALCVLTFSRGGMYNAVAGIVALLVFGFGDVTAGLRRVGLALAALAVFVLFIFPVIDDFTGGALEERFEDTGTSRRSDIALSDLYTFIEHPFLGVGVGAGAEYRKKYLGYGAASHTEFSRLISEHGFFGVGALILLAALMVINIRRPNSRPGRAFIAGIFVWSLSFMMNTGMRLAAPAFILGLGFAAIVAVRGSLPLAARFSRRDRILRLGGQPARIAPSNS